MIRLLESGPGFAGRQVSFHAENGGPGSGRTDHYNQRMMYSLFVFCVSSNIPC